MKKTEYLYHYTSRRQLSLILKKGYLKLTPSNLIKPTDLTLIRNEDGILSWVSKISDPVKPVVWLTDSLDPSGMGLDQPASNQKHEIRLTLPMEPSYKWWLAWAEENQMNKEWFDAFTSDCRYRTWYICESEIPLEKIVRIEDLGIGQVYFDAYA